MDNDDSLLNAIIIACIIGIIVVVALILTTDRDDGFTELYFLDYSKTPVSGILSFEYGIGNHEGMDMDYSLRVLVDHEIVAEKTVSVLDEDVYTGAFDLPYNLSGVHKVSVKLFGREEEIHFWTE